MYHIYLEPEGYSALYGRQYHIYNDKYRLIAAAAEVNFLKRWLSRYLDPSYEHITSDQLPQGKESIDNKFEFLADIENPKDILPYIQMHSLINEIPLKLLSPEEDMELYGAFK